MKKFLIAIFPLVALFALMSSIRIDTPEVGPPQIAPGQVTMLSWQMTQRSWLDALGGFNKITTLVSPDETMVMPYRIVSGRTYFFGMQIGSLKGMNPEDVFATFCQGQAANCKTFGELRKSLLDSGWTEHVGTGGMSATLAYQLQRAVAFISEASFSNLFVFSLIPAEMYDPDFVLPDTIGYGVPIDG